MIDIPNGRYWDLPWSLVDGCTPCSPGCDHCWSAAIAHRFTQTGWKLPGKPKFRVTGPDGKFDGFIVTHPERLSIPLKRRKPTVWAVWNDLYHEAVPESFRVNAYATMVPSKRHTFLILTKRASVMADFLSPHTCFKEPAFENIWHGLTVCNQQEADAKIPVFLQVPGKKFLSIEPMLGAIDLKLSCIKCQHYTDAECPSNSGGQCAMRPPIDAVILGGETGPGARPMHPDLVRSVRDQCAAAGVPFFFKQWGEWMPVPPCGGLDAPKREWRNLDNDTSVWRIGRNLSGRLLDGRTHDDLPWVKP